MLPIVDELRVHLTPTLVPVARHSMVTLPPWTTHKSLGGGGEMNCGNRIVSTWPVPGSVGELLTTKRPAWLLRSLSANLFRATHL